MNTPNYLPQVPVALVVWAYSITENDVEIY